MSKSLRRKAGILTTALAATAVAGAVLAPAASAASIAYLPGVTVVGQTSLTGAYTLDNDNDYVATTGQKVTANINGHYARYKLHSADTWQKKVEILDPSGKTVGMLITQDNAHDTSYVTVPESLYNKGYSLVFSKQKTFSVDRKFQVPLVNYFGGTAASTDQNNNPVGYDITLNWFKW